MKNGWTERIEELTKSRDYWKREWRLLNAGLNMAEDKIKELEAERDADRKREYGYSQQTVDALTLERDKLRAERNDWKARYQSVAEMHDALIAEFNEMRAENKRLAALNDMFPQEIARLEDRVSAEYEAERTDDRAKIEELKKENKRLRELVDGAQEVVEISNFTFPAQREWKAAWLKKAAQALKEASHE